MAEAPTTQEQMQQRVVRVFISSTFQDMHAEREELVKFTFPELRRRCRERQVEFTDVDLRWGISDEQKAEGKVLPICLAEIERCRPYFIALLGERYGWVPKEIEEELIKAQPWLTKHQERSVTELEILHGVLQNPAMKGLAFFYFRDTNTSQKIEADLSKQPNYFPEPEPPRIKLISLKDRIRKSGYPVHENYPDAKALGQRVLDDLWEVIDKRFPLEKVPSALEREQQEHEAFAEARRRVYLGREEYFKRLDEQAAGDSPPLVVLGDSGSGKSALLANWVKRYRKQHPDDFLLMHFIGSTADSAEYVTLLRRIMAEIKERDEPDSTTSNFPSSPNGTIIKGEYKGVELGSRASSDDIPTDPKKVVKQFPYWLAKAAAKGKFILILDALNQLTDRDNAPDLGWLPEYFPPNIRVILSTLPGRSLDALYKRKLPTITVEPLTQEERKQFIEKYLSQYTKELPKTQAERIAAATQSSNPMYLKALLEELRIYGDHVTLSQRIDHYLDAQTVDDLYDKILERYEVDYDRERKNLTKDALSLLWASRRGLSEAELLTILGTDNTPLPAAYWSPLKLAAEESLVSRSGLLNFFHDFLRKAVENRYVHIPELKKKAHLQIADYFTKQLPNERLPHDFWEKARYLSTSKLTKKIEITLSYYFATQQLYERKVDELPWQLQQAQEWKRLKDCIADMDIFSVLHTGAKILDLLGYWLSIGDRYDMVEVYNQSLGQFEKTVNEEAFAASLDAVATFFDLKSRYEEAEPIYHRTLQIREKVLGPEHRDTAASLDNLAGLLRTKGDYDGAEPICRRALQIREKVLGPEHPDTATSLNNLAGLLHTKGDYDGAEPLYRRALQIQEKVLGLEHPETAKILGNLAALLHVTGEYGQAELLYRRALQILEKVLGSEHIDTAIALNNLASLLKVQGDLDGAEPLSRRALQITEKVLGPEHPDTATSLNNLAGLLYDKEEYDKAEPLCLRGLQIREKVIGPEHPNTAKSMLTLASLLKVQGDLDGAEPLSRRALQITEKVLGPEHPDTAHSLHNLAGLLHDKGDYERAEPLCLRGLLIREKVLGAEHIDTAASLHDLAVLLDNKGDYEKAEPLYRRALQITEKVLGPEHPHIASNLLGLARLLYRRGDIAKSEPLYRKVLQIREKALGPEHPDTVESLNGLAALLEFIGEYGEAELLLRRVLQIREKVLGPEHPNTAESLNSLAGLLNHKGFFGKELLHRRALQINEKVLGLEHESTAESLNNLGMLLYVKGNDEEAKSLFKRALQIREKVLGLEHESTAESLNNLGLLLYSTRDYKSAELMFERALQIREKVLGFEHPATIKSLSNLGLLLYATGNYAEAESMRHRALQMTEKVLGPEHPDTAYCLANLAFSLSHKGDLMEAETLFRRALQIYKNSLGIDHPITSNVLTKLDDLLKQRGEHIEDIQIDIPSPHRRANPNQAAQLNIKYQEELKRWKALPWWKRIKVKKPEPPK